MTQATYTLELRTPRDRARIRLLEAITTGQDPVLPDVQEVASAFLDRGDFLDAGILIRTLDISAAKTSSAYFSALALAVAGPGTHFDHEQPTAAARIKALRKWVRIALELRQDQAAKTLHALLDADDLIVRRSLKGDCHIVAEWSAWAVRTVLSSAVRAPLLHELPIALASRAANREGKARELATRTAGSLGPTAPRWAVNFLRALSARPCPAQVTP